MKGWAEVMFKKKKNNEITDLQEMKPKKKKNKKVIKRVIVGSVIAVIVALIVLPKIFASDVLPIVTTSLAQVGDIEEMLSTSGFVESEDTQTYYSDVSAKITEFNVEKGSNIHGGDVLVAFDTAALENQCKQVELQNTASKADYAQTLNDAGENATKYQNSSTDVDVLNQQVDDQQNSVESIQMSINDESNYYAGLNSDLAQNTETLAGYEAELKTITDETAIAKLKKKIYKTNNKIDDIKQSIEKSNNYSTDLQNNLISAQSELSLLQSNLSEQKSIKATSEAGLLSGNEKIQKSATTEVTTLTLDQAKANLEKAKVGINAEFNGIITDVQAAKGATVAEGTALFTVASNESVKVNVSLSKYDLENVKEGQSAEITLGASTYTGTVSKISRVATTNAAGAAVINAEIHIDNPDDNIYLGVEAKVKISVGSASNVVLVPVECVNTDKTGEFCYVVENGIVVKKTVVSGLTSDEYIEVKEGISEGEEVVSEVTTDIIEGTKVITQPLLSTAVVDDSTVTDDAVTADSSENETQTTGETQTTDNTQNTEEAEQAPTQE
ncbi:MAG: efflux RND transporter periplasmic adaptor subunit [Lachnotalea sp.]